MRGMNGICQADSENEGRSREEFSSPLISLMQKLSRGENTALMSSCRGHKPLSQPGLWHRQSKPFHTSQRSQIICSRMYQSLCTCVPDSGAGSFVT